MASDSRRTVPAIVLFGGDPLVVRRLTKLAREHALSLLSADDVAAAPVVAVLDLDAQDALATGGEWHERWPETLIVGYSAVPDKERWVGAQRAGCSLVVNRGALARRLDERLRETGGGGRVLRRFPLFDTADAAGRLGCVYRGEDTPVGPIAVYRVDGRFCAVADRCPHAGAVLSTGEVEGTVVTCPNHGSQFDVTTGERVRGPADLEIATYNLVQEGGQVFVVVPG